MRNYIIILLAFLLTSCASFQLTTYNHDPLYGPDEVVLNVPSDVKIDTLSYSQLKWKLRTDFNFRWDFAQYAMDQPYSWYMSNYSFNPFNSFDMYWNRHSFWNEWAFNYPWFNYGWNYGYGGYNSFYNPYRPWWYRSYNPWNTWYNGPFNNPGYNVVWNSGRENSNIAYINGPRGSRGIPNNNIEDNIVTRYNKGRNSRTIDNSNENSTLNTIVSNLRDKFTNIRIYKNPNNVPVNINNNNGKPIIFNRGNPIIPNIKGSWRPSNNNLNINSTRPSYNNSSNNGGSPNINRGGSSSSGGSSSTSVKSSGNNSSGGRVKN